MEFDNEKEELLCSAPFYSGPLEDLGSNFTIMNHVAYLKEESEKMTGEVLHFNEGTSPMWAGAQHVHHMHLKNSEDIMSLKELVLKTSESTAETPLGDQLNDIMKLVIKIEANVTRMLSVQNVGLESITARFNAIDSKLSDLDRSTQAIIEKIE